jgi:hypothetical protein
MPASAGMTFGGQSSTANAFRENERQQKISEKNNFLYLKAHSQCRLGGSRLQHKEIAQTFDLSGGSRRTARKNSTGMDTNPQPLEIPHFADAWPAPASHISRT